MIERDDLGLSVDMLDVDRLRAWAHNIDTYGPNLMQWASPDFLVLMLREIADRLETVIRDIGELRKADAEVARLRVGQQGETTD